ncbi:TPA: DUF6161 domain-containing protein [Pseudomonas aeruginosa]
MDFGITEQLIQDKRFAILIDPTIDKDSKTNWLRSELEFWQNIFPAGRTKENLPGEVTTYLDALAKAYTEPTEENTERFIKVASLANIPSHDDPGQESLIKLLKNGQITQALYNFRLITSIAPEHYRRGFRDGKNAQLEEINDLISKSLKEVKEAMASYEKTIENRAKNARDEVQAIVVAATSAVTLSEPVKFWSARQQQHKESAQKYGNRALIAAAIFMTTLFGLIFYEYMSGVERTVFGIPFTLPKNAIGLASIVILTTGGIWAIRVFVKLMMANLTLETESLERATMIKTYVAMQAASGDISPENQLLFYTTLFRPSNNSINEDSTAPEFSKLLDIIVKARPDGK